ncbi:MAG: alpha/beta hydrolase [Lachnospiraceae bacterium]|nr:alpha/beta hydrolase [Lachnospiraceae bacterium]
MSFSDVVRKEFKISDEVRDAGLTTPGGVVRFDNICYVHKDATVVSEANIENAADAGPQASDKWHLLDVYRPRSASDTKLPVIVNVHGGGWVYGDKDVYQYYCMDMCLRGFAVVNFSYRLAPEYKYPAQLEDTCTAFRWVMENAEEYGFDTDSIYAVGDSAGANILALYCLMGTNEEYAEKYRFDVLRNAPHVLGDKKNADSDMNGNVDGGISYNVDEDITRKLCVPKAVALNCGAYDLNSSRREMKGFMSELMQNHGTPEEIEMLNVTKYINKNFPPTFLMTCYGDFLKDQAPLLEEKLKGLGIIYTSRLYGSEEEPLKHVFHCDIRMDAAKLCNDETCEFFGSIR